MEYIKPGHYCSESTLNTETKDIIRVLGRDPENPNYVITGDGKKIPEHTLLNGYVLLDTLATEADVNKSKSDIFRGLDNVISKHSSIITDDETYKTADFRDYVNYDKHEVHDRMIIKKQPPIISNPKTENKIKSLIERAKIDVLNEKEIRKHGIASYKKQTVTLPIEFQIEYDIKKLQQLIELFDIEPREVVSEIVSDIEIPHAILEKLIFDMLMSNNQNEFEREISQNITKSEEIQTKQNIEETISQVDSILSEITTNWIKS